MPMLFQKRRGAYANGANNDIFKSVRRIVESAYANLFCVVLSQKKKVSS